MAVVFIQSAVVADERPNVLFIAVDDLRPQMACYGKEFMQTPNLDRLASEGVLFERAYCMVPTCGASRAALMTSIRPARNRFTTHLTWAEKDAKDALPLHTHFKNNGYTTISLGKVFHHKQDHAAGWSQLAWRSGKPGYQDQAAAAAAQAEDKRQWPNKNKHNGPAYEAFEGDEENYADVDCTSRAIEALRDFSKAPDQPFFLAVGLLKPHLPFNAPKKYWDMYDRQSIELPENYLLPTDLPTGATHNSGELRAYAGIHPSAPLDRETAISLIHGYYACVSFADAQIGRLLDELDASGLSENTMVVLWGDHGWQLGEHGMWNKHSCFETSMHAPLIMRVPNQRSIAPGTRIHGLTEFIDIYPSLCELAGLEIPAHVQGQSLVSMMRDPSLPGKGFAVGRFGSGDTLRTDGFRFSEYTTPGGMPTGSMLFDHRNDPRENHNIEPQQADVVQEMRLQLHQRQGR